MNLVDTRRNNGYLIISLLFLVDFVTFLNVGLSVALLKVSIYAITVLLILKNFKNYQNSVLRKDVFWTLSTIYMILMFIRLSVDFFIPGKGFFLYKDPSTILFFYIMTMILPLWLLLNKQIKINLVGFCVVTGLVLFVCLLSSLQQVMQGSMVAATTGGQYSGGLDIISYGHYGLSLVFIAIYVWLFTDTKLLKILAITFSFVGLSGIVLSGSRSPIIAFLICGAIFYIAKTHKWKWIVVGAIVLYLLLNAIESQIYSFNNFLIDNGITSFNRVVETFWGGENIVDNTSGRNTIYSEGWLLFFDNILFGYGYLLPDESYVHNLFIEQFMALGVFGGVIFVIMNIIALKKSWALIQIEPKYTLIVVLFLQYLILGLFSRTAIANAPYWLFMFLVVNTYNNYNSIEQ